MILSFLNFKGCSHETLLKMVSLEGISSTEVESALKNLTRQRLIEFQEGKYHITQEGEMRIRNLEKTNKELKDLYFKNSFFAYFKKFDISEFEKGERLMQKLEELGRRCVLAIYKEPSNYIVGLSTILENGIGKEELWRDNDINKHFYSIGELEDYIKKLKNENLLQEKNGRYYGTEFSKTILHKFLEI